MPADPLPLRWTVVLWDGSDDGESVTVTIARCGTGWTGHVDGESHSCAGARPIDALWLTLRSLAPYRSAYPEGQDPVALEREACAEIAGLRARELDARADRCTGEAGERHYRSALALDALAAAIRARGVPRG